MRALIAFAAYNAILAASLIVAGHLVAPVDALNGQMAGIFGAMAFLVAESAIVASTIGPRIQKWVKAE